MNTNEQSFIKLNLLAKEFEISGSEEFINKYYENLKDLISNQTIVASPEFQSPQYSDTRITDNSAASNTSENFLHASDDKYTKAGIYVIEPESGKVIINKRIPGRNNAEKMKNIALITLFAKKTKIVGSEIKDMCKKQGCLDNSNFAATFTRDYETFIKTGNGQKWNIELTLKGEEDAKNLLESMINE